MSYISHFLQEATPTKYYRVEQTQPDPRTGRWFSGLPFEGTYEEITQRIPMTRDTSILIDTMKIGDAIITGSNRNLRITRMR